MKIRARKAQHGFAPLGGALSCCPLKVRRLAQRLRLPSCASSTGFRFMHLSGVADTVPPTRKTWSKAFFCTCLTTSRWLRSIRVRANSDPFCSHQSRTTFRRRPDRGRCLKRGGNIEFVPLDTKRAEDLYRLEPADFLTAETIFDARWATTLLNEAMVRLGNECAAQGKAATLQALEPFLDPSYVQVVPSYEQVADQLQVSIGAVKALIHRLRKQFSTILREQVA